MSPIFGESTVLWLGITIAAGYACVRLLEGRDLRKLVRQERECERRHPQLRLFR